MNNFFYNESDFSLFKKALKQTESEPVIINILSTDSSLKEANKHEEAPVVRKNLSSKFKPNPFNKFFGPRKQRTTPVDMGNFSSWKNKNYREAEQQISTSTETSARTTFSLADYMNQNTSEKKFNDVDQLKSETQKPITQLSSDDPTYKKYSLDSYLHKLEQQSQVKSEFEENSDILEPLVDMNMQEVVPTSGQDEVFGGASNVNVEDFSLDEGFAGERFSFEREELDKVRSRLDKLEREAQNIKEKQTEKVISTNELTDIAKDGEEDDFDLGKLGIDDEDLLDDIEKVNDKFGANDVQEKPDAPKVQGKRFFEINRNENVKPRTTEQEDVVGGGSVDDESSEETSAETTETSTETASTEATQTGSGSPEGVVISGDVTILTGGEGETATTEAEQGETASAEGEEKEEFVTGKTVSRDDILTKEDFRTITDEFMTKFTEMYQKGPNGAQQGQSFGAPAETAGEGVPPLDTDDEMTGFDGQSVPVYGDPYEAYGQEQTPVGYTGYGPAPIDNTQMLQQQQNELQAKIIEMLETNKKSDFEAEEKLRLAKLENQRMAQEYETRLKDLESSFRRRDEEMKKQAYLDKLKSDIKLKKAETSYKKKEEEFRELANVSSEKAKFGIMLKKELENNLNISNLEMDKKLLEVASKNKKKLYDEELAAKEKAAKVVETEVVEEEVEEEEVVEKPKKTTTKKTTTRRRTTTGRTTTRPRSRTRTPRRKIDSDIIGGIDFE